MKRCRMMGVKLTRQPFDAEALLEEPSPTQLRILEFIAEGFVQYREWPVFDYVAGHFEAEGISVWNELRSLPIHPQGYYAVALPTNREPDPGGRIALTMLGLFQAEVMGRAQTHLDRPFLFALVTLAAIRRDTPRSYNAPRSFKITSAELLERLAGAPDRELTPQGLRDLFEREPPFWGSGFQVDGEGDWEMTISPAVLRFYGVKDIRDYLRRVVEMLTLPAFEAVPAAPSPLGLVAAVDYLDTVWRLAHDKAPHLFNLHSAQATAQLAFDANTPAEFESRMSALGDILRSCKVPKTDVPAAGEGQGAKSNKGRDKPLTPLERHLVALLPESSGRIEAAIGTLGNVIDVRDGGQHSGARGKGAVALAALGVGYPPRSWPDAWNTISAKAIEALDAIREELATLSP
jgi:hypothetical protein